jgi:hypothetical protein
MPQRVWPTLEDMSWTNKAVTAAAVAIAVCGMWPAVAAADPEPPPAPKTTIDADGTYTVGTQIAPGAYSTAGPVGDGACHYKLVSGDNVKDNVFTKKPQVVQVAADDTTFKTDGCQPWQPTDCTSGCGTPDGSPAQILGQLGQFLLPRIGSGPPATSAPAAPPG